MTQKTLLQALTYTAAGIITGVAALAMIQTNAYAETQTCYGPYGQEIDCPIVNKSFAVEKRVRMAGTNDQYVETLENVKVSNEVEFEIVVTNTGEATIDGLNVLDVLPTNLDITSNSSSWILDNFEPGEVWDITLTAKANDEGITTSNEKCVTNVVNLVYTGQKEASDTAVVCISKDGEVLSQITELPKTGVFGPNDILGYSIISIILGMIVISGTLLVREAVRES